MRFRSTLAAAVVAMLIAGAQGAAAAQPATGSVSPAATDIGWTGTVTGANLVTDIVQASQQSTVACAPPLCDTFTLTVSGSDGTLPLQLSAAMTTAGNSITLEVVLPDGQTAYAGSTPEGGSLEPERRITVPGAPDGTYVVHVTGDTRISSETFDYVGTARLGEPLAGCERDRLLTYETGGAPLTGSVTNDPLYPRMHGLALMDVAGAWARDPKKGRGKGVTIAVIDTGVDANHPDLAPNIVPGVDLLEGRDGDCAAGPMDVHTHGTHAAGLAAAAAGNGLGIAGVAPKARIMPIRTCDKTGNCDPDAVATGIRWAVEHGADVINLSLGVSEFNVVTGSVAGGELIDPAVLDSLADDVAFAHGHGVVVVAAAMNNTWAFCGHPAADPHAICVAATDKRGLPTTYSNLPADDDGEALAFRAFGGGSVFTDATACDELAISTVYPGTAGLRCGRAYDGLQGTSMASPQVAGAVAVLLSLGATPAEAVTRLRDTASGGGRYDPVMGYGIPDLEAASAGLPRRR